MTFRETPTTPNRYAKPTNENNNANHENGVFASTPSAHTKQKGACSPMRNEWDYRNKDARGKRGIPKLPNPKPYKYTELLKEQKKRAKEEENNEQPTRNNNSKQQ